MLCRAQLLLVVFGLLRFGVGQTNGMAKHPAPQYGQPPQDLANALVQMARTSRVPLIAELVQPLPDASTSEGVSLDSETLNQLLQRAPGYEWKMEGKIAHFYNRKLRSAHYNFLNLKFPRFTIPPNLSDLKLWFPGRATGLLEGLTGEGGATTGFPDNKLASETLQRETLENVSPLQVLIHIANERPTFYVVLVFPTSVPTKHQAEHDVVWHWGSLSEKMKPLYTQFPRMKR
jgi:hypothetical protein